MDKTAIIIGASGLTGGIILDKLLKDERYSSVKIFSRRSLKINHLKLMEYVGSLFELESFKECFTADEVYCCIGTTAKKTPDKAVYKKIDHGIPVVTAKLCKENSIDTLLIISALGADLKSSIFYSKTKGEMERDVVKENIKNTYFLRPSVIIGERNEKRLGETIGITIINLFQFILVGSLRKYRSIKADKIANAMIELANTKPDLQIINSDKIQEIG